MSNERTDAVFYALGVIQSICENKAGAYKSAKIQVAEIKKWADNPLGMKQKQDYAFESIKRK